MRTDELRPEELHRRRVEQARAAAGPELLAETEATLSRKKIQVERRPHSRQTWRDAIINELITRDGNLCYLCCTPLEPKNIAAIHIDHVIPESLGGAHLIHNLALACPDCNTQKADKIVAFDVTSERPWYALHGNIATHQ